MSRRQRPSTPLLEPMDGPLLVELGNWLIDSVDVSELPNEQVLFLWMLVERLTNALWRAFPEVLLVVAMRGVARWDADQGGPDDSGDDSDD